MENSQQSVYVVRKIKERIFTATLLIFSLVAVIPLFLVLGYVFINGISAITYDFFTKLPTPVGEAGGGIANAIVGSGMIVALACAFGLPIGILGGIWLAEQREGKTAFGWRGKPAIWRAFPDRCAA